MWYEACTCAAVNARGLDTNSSLHCYPTYVHTRTRIHTQTWMSHWVNFEAWKIFPKSYSNPAACVNNHQLKADDLNKCLDKPVWTSSRYRTNRQCRRWSDERSIMKCLLEQCSCWEESTPTLDQLTASGSSSSSTAQREIKDERRNKNNSQIQKKKFQLD